MGRLRGIPTKTALLKAKVKDEKGSSLEGVALLSESHLEKALHSSTCPHLTPPHL